MTLKLVGREILSIVKLGGEKWGVGGRAGVFLPIPSREFTEKQFTIVEHTADATNARILKLRSEKTYA